MIVNGLRWPTVKIGCLRHKYEVGQFSSYRLQGAPKATLPGKPIVKNVTSAPVDIHRFALPAWLEICCPCPANSSQCNSLYMPHLLISQSTNPSEKAFITNLPFWHRECSPPERSSGSSTVSCQSPTWTRAEDLVVLLPSWSLWAHLDLCLPLYTGYVSASISCSNAFAIAAIGLGRAFVEVEWYSVWCIVVLVCSRPGISNMIVPVPQIPGSKRYGLLASLFRVPQRLFCEHLAVTKSYIKGTNLFVWSLMIRMFM